MSQIATDLLLGALLALSVLGVGFLLGIRVGRWIAPGGSDEANSSIQPRDSDTGTTEFHQLLSQWHDVRPRLGELASRLRELKQPPHNALAQWRSDLVRVTAELRETLKNKLRGTDSIARARSAAGGCKSTVAAIAPNKQLLTNEQIVRILEQREQQPKTNGEARPPDRHKFSAKQLIVSLPDDGGLPSTIREVQCDDLSVREIRYFVAEAPITKRVIVGLGVPSPVKWLMAEIVDCRPAFLDGKQTCLVTARFLASVDNSRRMVQTSDRVTKNEQLIEIG
jgi:hypothetical protein